jgi:hypothetical protein
MTKRTFVLFFCLVQALALSLFSEQSMASYKPQLPPSGFVPYVLANQEVLEEFDICPDQCPIDSPIVQADECEWKESLADMLRHRHSSYRFTIFETAPSSFLDLIPDLKCLSKALKPHSIYLSNTVLPDYYSFLHRLCPF